MDETSWNHNTTTTWMEESKTDKSNMWSQGACDWLLSSIYPLTQMTILLLYVPIRQVGYTKVYHILFQIQFWTSLTLLLWKMSSSSFFVLELQDTTSIPIAFFLVCNSVLTGAVVNVGFIFGMSDLVLEMKWKKQQQQCHKEQQPPSLSGMFMGMNTLFCRPMSAFLPIVTACWLNHVGLSATGDDDGGGGGGDANHNVAGSIGMSGSNHHERILADYLGIQQHHHHDMTTASTKHGDTTTTTEEDVQWVLFYMMVVPTFLFSILQLLMWHKYDLNGDKVKQMRMELEQQRIKDTKRVGGGYVEDEENEDEGLHYLQE